MQASFVTLNWRRPQNVRRIVDHVLTMDWCAEVLVWNNSREPLPCWDDSRVYVFSSDCNRGTWGRYLATQYASHELIATQDDDYLPAKEHWQKLFDAFDGNSIVALTEPRRQHYDRHMPWCLVGWGALFRKQWVDEAFAPYLTCYGEDSVLRSKADRMFSILARRNKKLIPDTIPALPGVRGPESLYLRTDHKHLIKGATARAQDFVQHGCPAS